MKKRGVKKNSKVSSRLKNIRKNTNKKNVLLIILDGFGVRKEKAHNAVLQANMPFYNYLLKKYDNILLKASGNAVGLPEGYIGNSEVGHMNLGAGRVVDSDLERINKSIKNRSFFRNRKLLAALENVKKHNSTLHIMGLCSDAGVHSHINHLFALIDMAKMNKIENLYIHCFLDGRDTDPMSAKKYIKMVMNHCKKRKLGEISTIIGRFYSMDRDSRWHREHKAYDAMVNKVGLYYYDPLEAIEAAYKRKERDEFVTPSIIYCKKHNQVHNIKNHDSLIFFNFRSDRAREITRIFVQPDFDKFKREKLDIFYVAFTEYEKKIKTNIAFPEIKIKNCVGEVISKNKLPQFRIAETEKYAHVTYFYNCGEEKPFEYEDRLLIPSPKVKTYDLKPEMSLYTVTEHLLREIQEKKYKFILVNFANPDMVGHTGNFSATLAALEASDRCLKKIVEEFKEQGHIIITADHGNCEDMSPGWETSHTISPVRCILVSDLKFKQKYHKKPGLLPQVGPTVLKLLGIKKPKEMMEPLI